MTEISGDRIRRAEGILEEMGFSRTRVEVSGPQEEIASVVVGDEDWARAAGDSADGIANRLKLLGFRYVAVDLDLLT